MMALFLKLCLFMYMFFLPCDLFSMDLPFKYNNENSDTQNIVKPYLTQLYNVSEGKKLLNKIKELYKRLENPGTITFKQGNITSFYTQKSEDKVNLIIEVNVKESSYPSLHRVDYTGLYGISEEPAQFCITLAHELIHLKHKLEELNNTSGPDSDIKYIPYSTAKCIGISDVFQSRYDLFLCFPN